MSTNAQGWPTRLRRAGVAVVLVVGAGAAIATTPAVAECPDPPPDGVVSDFYGQQDSDWDMVRGTSPSEFAVSGYDIVQGQVSAPSCLTADDAGVPVAVDFMLGYDQLGPIPEETLRTLTVEDGLGRSWSPREVTTRERFPATSEGGEQSRSYARVQFQLPIDLVAPVSLHLGALGDATLSELSLDEARPTPDATSPETTS
ncbi:hypothetical protein [Cellulomonas soli]|uniref:Uncharacterized protein n=1 Tax=Cellulomonas soli TaxID=931535 RepID=A0A512PBT6_9CELL|nr:hypothetical protein [Cellulomonas soli]NYI58260.1 hypothetical protein [Cellulomonas soli]GEP68680.1 hypothetical protein CSO01_13950 [Cellulomonas soli]